MSLIPLWSLMTCSPLQQLKVCSTPFAFIHVHMLGNSVGCHSYLSATTSWKASLCKVETQSSIGRLFKQKEDNFCFARDIAFLSLAFTTFKLFQPSSLVFLVLNLHWIGKPTQLCINLGCMGSVYQQTSLGGIPHCRCHQLHEWLIKNHFSRKHTLYWFRIRRQKEIVYSAHVVPVCQLHAVLTLPAI